MKYIIFLSLFLSITGCGSKILHTPQKIEINEAIAISEELMMTQDKRWRPDGYTINEEYISFGYGTSTETPKAFSTHVSTRDVGDRIYYKNIKNLRLIKWSSRLKTWYLVTVFYSGSRFSTQHKVKHIYYSRYQKNSELFYDALNSIMTYYNNSDIEIKK